MTDPMGFSGPVEDRLAIRELNDTYSDMVIRQDVAALMTLWEEDAVWTHPDVGDSAGIAAIGAIFTAAFKAYPMVVMTSTPGQLAIDGNVAHGRLYIDEIVRNDQGATYRVKGLYTDQYAKADGRWRFRRRDYRLLYRG